MNRPRYLPDSIVAQLVSVFASLHSLDPERTTREADVTMLSLGATRRDLPR